MRISSNSNPGIKRIRSLRQRKERERSGLFFIEGIRLVAEAVHMGAPIDTLIVAPDILISPLAHNIVTTWQAQGRPCLDVSAEVFQSISTRDGPQGIAAIVHQTWHTLDDLLMQPASSWVALDSIQDPGNLGSILRTSDAVGFAGVILLGPTTDPYDPSALRASMGAIFAQRLVRATYTEFATWKQQYPGTLIGTADAAVLDYQAIRYTYPLILLMGSERTGLSAEQQSLCDSVVRIPMVGRSDSLNLAVATGVMLYEIFTQQHV